MRHLAVLVPFLFLGCGQEDSQTTTRAPEPEEPVAPVHSVAVVAFETAPSPARRLRLNEDAEAIRTAVEAATAEGEKRMALTLDRPLVRPGETVWVRVWDLHAGSLDSSDPTDVRLSLLGPGGNELVNQRLSSNGAGLSGGGGGTANGVLLPRSAVGGLYTLRATTTGATVERPFVVATFEEPRIRKELELLRDAYGPGDDVVAALMVSSSGSGPLIDHLVKVVVQVKGRTLRVIEARTDTKGEATLRFTLPRDMRRPDAVLTVLVEEQGWSESISRDVPVVLDRVGMEWFPEGGRLVAGLPSRVYLRARDAHGEPADVAGEIVDDAGVVTASFRTAHDGLGRFALTPQPGRTYRARLIEPISTEAQYRLPSALPEGCVLRGFDDLDGVRPELRIGVWCTAERRVVVTGSLRGHALAPAMVLAGPDAPAVVHLRGETELDQGVARVTVLSEDLEPLAERLMYRNRGRQLQIQVVPDRPRFGPRDEVVLNVTTSDPDGAPVAADVALSVVDDRLLKHANDEHGHLLTQLHLDPYAEGGLEDPGWYFDREERLAGQGLDLVMGTYGWRRFERRGVAHWPPALRPLTPALGLDGYPAEGLLVLGALRGSLGTHRGTGRTVLAGGQPVILGSVGRGAVDEVIRRHINPLRHCYQRELSKHPGVSGKVVIKFTIARDGAVSAASVRSTTMHNPSVEECVVGRFWRMRFPEPGAGTIALVSYPFLFRPGDEARAMLPAPAPVQYTTVRAFPKLDYGGQPTPSVRTDFRSTVLWDPSVRTSDDGTARVSFFLNDAVTTFRVTAEGVGGGNAGRAEVELHSTRPFSLDVPLPTEVSFGDRLLMPVRLRSQSDQAVEVALTTEISAPLEAEDGTGTQRLTIEPDGG